MQAAAVKRMHSYAFFVTAMCSRTHGTCNAHGPLETGRVTKITAGRSMYPAIMIARLQNTWEALLLLGLPFALGGCTFRSRLLRCIIRRPAALSTLLGASFGSQHSPGQV